MRLPLLQIYVLNFPVATMLIMRWKKLVLDVFLLGTFQIHTFCCPFLVPLIFLIPLRRLLEKSLLSFHTCTSLYWCRTFYRGMVLIKYVLIKCSYLTFMVAFGPIYSIGSALVPYPPFEIVSLVEAALTRCTPRFWCPYRIGTRTGWGDYNQTKKQLNLIKSKNRWV